MARSKGNGEEKVVAEVRLELSVDDWLALQKIDREAFPEKPPLKLNNQCGDRVAAILSHALQATAYDQRWDRLFTLQKANVN